MILQDEAEHEHARLVLMLEPEPTFRKFVLVMRQEFFGMTLARLQELYMAYMGWDGRTRPWLSIETGKRL